MILTRPSHRRGAALFARVGVVSSLVGLVFTASGLVLSSGDRASAATSAGAAQVIAPNDGSPGAGQPLDTGGSKTAFTLNLPPGASCSGDSANAGYRVQSYMVPASVSPAGLTFGSAGPLPAAIGTNFRQPLFSTTGSPFVNKQTANADAPNGPGAITNIGTFDYGVFGPGDIPVPGTYNLGIACTVGSAGPTQLDKYWNVQVVFSANDADSPAKIRWDVIVPPASTTLALSATPSTSAIGASVAFTAAVTPSAATGSVTFKDGGSVVGAAVAVTNGTATLTTSALTAGDHAMTAEYVPADAKYGPSTSNPLSFHVNAAGAPVQPSTPTATDAGPLSTSAQSTTDPAEPAAAPAVLPSTGGRSEPSPSVGRAGGGAGQPSTGSTFGSVAELAATGASSASLVVWALLLLCFGRMAVLLSRPVPVRSA